MRARLHAAGSQQCHNRSRSAVPGPLCCCAASAPQSNTDAVDAVPHPFHILLPVPACALLGHELRQQRDAWPAHLCAALRELLQRWGLAQQVRDVAARMLRPLGFTQAAYEDGTLAAAPSLPI
eukprot:CAMPEP_0202415504 /NCGR_PEP_ID=MMETSP1128-20130828/36391_1 /ASSEMBLY_ACC=CAM_ASM_000463 /TAXON_ID=3047 /ORGANISM="Dunaliella tertiolecta, Strain CCMP1320" /LENGTH=122 /DNA_ID=CAMNT_0049022207 /DNA_START=710 /DNA_END=1078 /DNA_ORIENTATION=-